jgi:hypothetical protein
MVQAQWNHVREAQSSGVTQAEGSGVVEAVGYRLQNDLGGYRSPGARTMFQPGHVFTIAQQSAKAARCTRWNRWFCGIVSG